MNINYESILNDINQTYQQNFLYNFRPNMEINDNFFQNLHFYQQIPNDLKSFLSIEIPFKDFNISSVPKEKVN